MYCAIHLGLQHGDTKLKTGSESVSLDTLKTAFIEPYRLNLTLYSPVVTICTVSLTFTDSLLRPQSVFMCFVWISEQTAIISLYNIN